MAGLRAFLRTSTLLAAMNGIPLAALAQEPWSDVYVCGGSSGHSYFLNGDGWAVDAISKGVVVLKRRGADFDLDIGDASGGRFSAREDGAEVIARQQEGVIQVLVFYPTLTIETYLFASPSKGRTTLAWTSSKRSGIADRASVFVSPCIQR